MQQEFLDRTKKSLGILKNIVRGSSLKKLRFLDVGCGDGNFLERVVSLDKRIETWGVDISSLAIKKAKEKGFRAFTVDVCKEKLPFGDLFFDLVYMGEVIEHLFDPDFAIKEVRRTLKKEGVLILTTPNLAAWHNRLLLFLGYQPLFSEVSTKRIFGRPGQTLVGHLRLFTLRALKDFLTYYQFKIMKTEGACFFAFSSPLKEVDKIFSNFLSLSSTLVVVAKK